MHFLTLVSVKVDSNIQDKAEDQVYREKIAELQEKSQTEKDNFMVQIFLEKYRGLTSSFARAVDRAVEDAMAPYSENTSNSQYCEFVDRTDELKEDYKHGTAPCVRFSNGEILETWNRHFSDRFEIRNGTVVQRIAGKLHHPKRTKKAKRFTFLKDYPLRKLYPTFKAYADDTSNYCDEEQAYGYYCNPKAFWDWYSIGGRGPLLLLVKDDCDEFSIGERSTEYDTASAPTGYKWAVAARKKDIAWDVMKGWEFKSVKDRYLMLKEAFEKGTIPENMYAHITDEGIQGYKLFYAAGESFEDYLARHNLDTELKCHVGAYGFLNEEGWNTADDFGGGWVETLNGFIDSLDDDDVIVGVNNHM